MKGLSKMPNQLLNEEMIALLEEEGDLAADYLEELLDICDLDGDIDIDIENGRALVEVIEDGDTPYGLQKLIGKDGQVLDALQELMRLSVQISTGKRSRLMLDIAGFRKNRRMELSKIADEAVTAVLAKGEPMQLPPMNSFERKICHDVVAQAGLISNSDGTEPERYVVVYPPNTEL